VNNVEKQFLYPPSTGRIFLQFPPDVLCAMLAQAFTVF